MKKMMTRRLLFAVMTLIPVFATAQHKASYQIIPLPLSVEEKEGPT